MPVFRILRKRLSFSAIRRFGEIISPIFENPSHFSAIFRLKNAKISLLDFRISLRNSRITLSNPKISLSDFRGVKIFAKISQICALFCQKSRVKTFYFFVKIFRFLIATKVCSTKKCRLHFCSRHPLDCIITFQLWLLLY